MSNKPFPFSVCKECCENEIKELHAKDITYSNDAVEGENVEEAIGNLANKMRKNAADIKSNEDIILENNTRIGSIESDVATNASDIRSLGTQVDNNNVSISENSTAISEVDERLSNELTSLEGRIDNNVSDIQGIKDDVETNAASIEKLTAKDEQFNANIRDLSGDITYNRNIINEHISGSADNHNAKDILFSGLDYAENVEDAIKELDGYVDDILNRVNGNETAIDNNLGYIEEIRGELGNVGTALDSIIAIQNSLIGGDSV